MEEQKNEINESQNKEEETQPVETASVEVPVAEPTPPLSDVASAKSGVVKVKVEEFSLRWHLKVLAWIYGGLFLLYVILKLTLK